MIKVKSLAPFKILYTLPDGTNIVVIIGGRGGAKTYEVSKFTAFSSTVKEKRVVILRDEKETIRESILNEILKRFDTANVNNVLGQVYERLETGIKDRRNDTMMVFTKGFRASSKQKTANLKGVSDIDIAVVEEAEDIRDPNKFNTFADSIRKEGSLIVIILNTPDIGHWIIKRFFNAVQITFEDVPELKGRVNEKEIDGYYRLISKEINGFVCIQTSFEDNPHLPDHIIHNYKSYGDPTSNTFDLHYYLTAIKGFASTGRKGQVLKKAKPISLKEYLSLPYKEYYGQDFGTASPAGFVGVKKHRNKIWWREINYEPKSTLDIGKMYCLLNIHPTKDKVIADNADRGAWTKLASGWERSELSPEDVRQFPGLLRGWDVVPCVKGQGSINDGISSLDSKEMYVVQESDNAWEELRNYVYAQDKYGNYTSDPIDAFNHVIDPVRYVNDFIESGSADGGMERSN